MQEAPYGRSDRTFWRETIECVVPNYHERRHGYYEPARKVYQSCQNDHAETQNPDDAQEDLRVVEVEEPAEADNGEFEYNQPKAPLEKPNGKFPFSPTPANEEGRSSSQENKDRRAEMRHEARPEKRAVSSIEVHGIEEERVDVKVIPHVVKCHDDHDEATQ